MGNTTLWSVYYRCKRLAFLIWGWPWRLAAHLDDELSAKTVEDFQADHDLMHEYFEWCDRPAGVPAECTSLAARSSFKTTPVKQMVAAAKEYRWTMGEDFKRKVGVRASLGVQSVLVEETLGDMKNRQIPRQTSLFRRPETCYYLGLHRGSLEVRTNWDTPPIRHSPRDKNE